MTRKEKITTDFGDLSDPIYSDTITVASNTLTLNVSSFTGLAPTTGVVMTALGLFNTNRLKPYYLGQPQENAALRVDVDKLVTPQCEWINNFADGNGVLLRKSGYPLQKSPESQGILPQTTIVLEPTFNPGEAYFNISHIKGAGIHYGLMFTLSSNPEPNFAKWTFYYAAQRQGTMSGLESDKEYKIVSFAMGTEKQIVYSTVETVTPR